MKTKTKLIIAIALIICASSIFFSYAYFIRITTSKNIITFGSLKLKLINNTIVDGKEVPIEDGGYIDIASNSEASRIVRVKNVGRHPMYVRIYLDVFFGGEKIDEEHITEYMNFDISDNWTYEDGYYYYNDVLRNDYETDNLFTKIMFNTAKIRQDGYAGRVDIKINVQAVQRENNSRSVLDAYGWPEKQ